MDPPYQSPQQNSQKKYALISQSIPSQRSENFIPWSLQMTTTNVLSQNHINTMNVSNLFLSRMKRHCLKQIKYMMNYQKLCHLQTITTKGFSGNCSFLVIIPTRLSVKMSTFQGSSILKIHRMSSKFSRILDDSRLLLLYTSHLLCFSHCSMFLWYSASYLLLKVVEYAVDHRHFAFQKDGSQWFLQSWLKSLTLFSFVCWQYCWQYSP